MTLNGAELAGLFALGGGAGWLGAVLGIGGGVVIVPALVLGFGFPTRAAVAISLVAVAANSIAASSTYVARGLAHKRLALTLEIATTLGGITGGLVAGVISRTTLTAVFAAVMLVTAALTVRAGGGEEAVGRDPVSVTSPDGAPVPWEQPGTLAAAYRTSEQQFARYRPSRLPLGGAASYLAGVLSGLLGVGGGFLKVPAMTVGMRVPLRVAAATSNFMIGITAVSSLIVYFVRGDVRPFAAAPVVLGIVAGALGGAASSERFSTAGLGRLFGAVLVAVAVLMALKATGFMA